MTPTERSDLFEENLGRLLEASAGMPDAAFEQKLLAAVRSEVRAERSRQVAAGRRPARRVAWLAAAAVLVAVVVLWRPLLREPEQAQPTAFIRPLHGLVTMRNGAGATDLTRPAPIHLGQWVGTLAGSEAEITLADQSRLVSKPHTLVQIEGSRGGEAVFLKSGTLSVQAARQAKGKQLRIRTPGAQISVLGTRFDVCAVQKADGRTQTRVSVESGKVTLESAGKVLTLRAGAEGISEEGSAPRRRSLTHEVNELLRLEELSWRLAAERGLKPGAPAIVEFNGDATADVWLAARLPNDTRDVMTRTTLRCREARPGTQAFAADGAVLPLRIDGKQLRIDLSEAPLSPGSSTFLILRLPRVGGLFHTVAGGAVEFSTQAEASCELALLQLRLPDSATIEAVRPEPLETSRTLSRISLTLPTQSKLPELFDDYTKGDTR